MGDFDRTFHDMNSFCRNVRTLLILVAVAGLAVGCNTIQTRAKERPGVWESLDAATQARLRSGHIELGDTTDAVYIAIGAPNSVRRRDTGEGRSEIWIYTRDQVKSDGIGVVGYSRYAVRDGDGRLVGVMREPVYGQYRHVETEVALSLTFRGGKVVEMEQ